MTYAILGAGNVGQALAKAFARKGLEVTLASRRSAEELAPIAKAIGPTVKTAALKDAVGADVVILAVPFGTYKEVAQAAASWQGKTVNDAMNAYKVPPAEYGGVVSSVAVAKAFTGAKLAKAFNHLPAATLAKDPEADGLRRVIFLASDDAGTLDSVSALVEQLGFAPVPLGSLAEGGAALHARGNLWGPLSFQDVLKARS